MSVLIVASMDSDPQSLVTPLPEEVKNSDGQTRRVRLGWAHQGQDPGLLSSRRRKGVHEHIIKSVQREGQSRATRQK